MCMLRRNVHIIGKHAPVIWVYIYVNACLSLPAGTQIIPQASCLPTTEAPNGETSTSTSCTARKLPFQGSTF